MVFIGRMKRPKALTRTQKQVISSHGFNANDWLLLEEWEFYYKLIHKVTGRIIITDKFFRGKKRK